MVAASLNPPAAGKLLIERVFDAPRALVFAAWIDPDHLARWYAPNGCTTTFRKLEARPGGTFHSCVRGPDGGECWCRGVYREVAPPDRLVFTTELADEEGNPVESEEAGKGSDWPRETTVTVTFADENGKTRITLHQTVQESVAKRTGAHPSWIQMLDRLAGHLAEAEKGNA